MWGYSGHPLIDGNKLICVAGGEGTHAVAFDKNTGEEIWHTLSSPEQGYSPPTIIEAGGKRQLILVRPSAVSSVDPETGREYWSVPYEATSGSIIMSPVRSGKYLYVGGYSNKIAAARAGRGPPGGRNRLARQAAARHLADQRAADHRRRARCTASIGTATLYGVELPSGKRLWDTTEPISRAARCDTGTAFIVRQGDTGDRYWLFNDSGDLIIAQLIARRLRGNRPHTPHRADQPGVRPRRRLVHAGVRQQANVRAQRRGVHLRRPGETVAGTLRVPSQCMSTASTSDENLILRDHLALDRTRLANERTLLAYIRTAFMLLVAAPPR